MISLYFLTLLEYLCLVFSGFGTEMTFLVPTCPSLLTPGPRLLLSLSGTSQTHSDPQALHLLVLLLGHPCTVSLLGWPRTPFGDAFPDHTRKSGPILHPGAPRHSSLRNEDSK